MQIFAKKKKRRGFTLIELLVVIAIIGILASIVLVSLSSAKNRAKDARIIASIGQIRTSAEIHQGNVGNYSGLCENPDIGTLQTDISAQGGTSYLCKVNTNNLGYCVKAKLNSTKWWCADSALRSQQYDDDPATCVDACVAADTCKCE